jgi:hypothetical protein
MNNLVESIGAEYDTHQKQLFRDSLHAALTLDEVKQLISQADLQGVIVYQSSDRHWTAERRWRQGGHGDKGINTSGVCHV